MAQMINFTKRALETLPLPKPGTRETYYDTKIPSLAVRVTATGTKTFIVRRRIAGGQAERITLGTFPAMMVDQARRLAAQVNASIARGENPNDKKRSLRAEMTLGELFDAFLERHAKVHKRSWLQDQAKFNRYLVLWANRKLSAIRKSDVQVLHAKIGRDHGIYAANRTLEMLKTMYNKAIDWGFDKPNPAQGVKKFKEQSRDRFLQADELPRFFQALAEEPNADFRDYFLVALLTGARRANVLAMRWEQINFARGTWTIPTTKNGESHTLPLVGEAIAVLNERKSYSESPWVFPGTGKAGHLMEPKKAWARILSRAGIENLHIHDLRRSLGSWQAATGASLSIIGKTLAHKNVSTTAIYARLNLDPVRNAMETATRAMLDAAGVGEKAEVVTIGKKAG